LGWCGWITMGSEGIEGRIDRREGTRSRMRGGWCGRTRGSGARIRHGGKESITAEGLEGEEAGVGAIEGELEGPFVPGDGSQGSRSRKDGLGKGEHLTEIGNGEGRNGEEGLGLGKEACLCPVHPTEPPGEGGDLLDQQLLSHRARGEGGTEPSEEGGEFSLVLGTGVIGDEGGMGEDAVGGGIPGGGSFTLLGSRTGGGARVALVGRTLLGRGHGRGESFHEGGVGRERRCL
jgi:hypothetical protein